MNQDDKLPPVPYEQRIQTLEERIRQLEAQLTAVMADRDTVTAYARKLEHSISRPIVVKINMDANQIAEAILKSPLPTPASNVRPDDGRGESC